MTNSMPLMQKAVAVWMVDHTILTFDQIAHFCSLHPLEVKGIADGEVAEGILGCNPLATGEITQEEVDACGADPKRMPSLIKFGNKGRKNTKGSRAYVPVARRRAKPDAVYWLLSYSPELNHNQIVRLIGTTLSTVGAIGDGTYWNMSNLRPRDPVLLRLCTKENLDDAVLKARVSRSRELSYQKAIEHEESETVNAQDATFQVPSG